MASSYGWIKISLLPAQVIYPKYIRLFLDPYISEGEEMATVTTILKVRQEDKPLLYEALQRGRIFIHFR